MGNEIYGFGRCTLRCKTYDIYAIQRWKHPRGYDFVKEHSGERRPEKFDLLGIDSRAEMKR